MYSLIDQPRRQPGSLRYRGTDWHFVDAASCFSAWQAIDGGIYRFPARDDSSVILDLGANIGWSTRFFAEHFPQGRVIAFEPDPVVFACLQANCGHYANVELKQLAVSATNDSITFRSSRDDAGRIFQSGEKRTSDTDSETDDELIQVSATTLDSILQEFERVDLIKIDIEGAEIDVLIQSRHSLGNISRIFVEYHSFLGQEQRLGSLLNLLSDAGFRYSLHSEYQLKSPFMESTVELGMDFRVNVFAVRDSE